jgi:hypothetical protein
MSYELEPTSIILKWPKRHRPDKNEEAGNIVRTKG